MRNRPDMDGAFQSQYHKIRKQVLAEESICAICGQPVDKTLKFPHPMSPTVDHIIPVAKGGHPASRDNMQLAHLICNQVKSSRLTIEGNKPKQEAKEIGNRNLPQSMNWSVYRGAWSPPRGQASNRRRDSVNISQKCVGEVKDE